MKTTENKGFGIIGIKIELSVIEMLAIAKLKQELYDIITLPGPQTPLAVIKAANFLCNISSYQLDKDIELATMDIFSDKKADEEMARMKAESRRHEYSDQSEDVRP